MCLATSFHELMNEAHKQPAAQRLLVKEAGEVPTCHRVWPPRPRTITTNMDILGAGTQARFEEGYRKIAEVARIHGWDDPTVNILRLVRSWLCDESNRQWLMIVDNTGNFSVLLALHGEPQTHAANSLDRPTESPSEFLPQSANGSILITS